MTAEYLAGPWNELQEDAYWQRTPPWQCDRAHGAGSASQIMVYGVGKMAPESPAAPNPANLEWYPPIGHGWGRALIQMRQPYGLLVEGHGFNHVNGKCE